MSHQDQNYSAPKSLDDIEEVIDRAIKKVKGKRENDLCKFLPIATGGYMHHFTLRKMKLKEPFELGSLIEKFIINPVKPTPIAPKQRAARGSRKRKDQMTFTKGQLERLLNMAKLSGDKEMVSVLSPRKSLAACKRDLIKSIRSGVVDEILWASYVDSVNAHNAAQEYATAKLH